MPGKFPWGEVPSDKLQKLFMIAHSRGKLNAESLFYED